jgi:DNA-binding MarR family transcriptional regulator
MKKPTSSSATATDLRDAAFWSLEDLGGKQTKVFEVIRRLAPCTDRQIARALGWEINRITGRRNELVAMGLVERSGTTTDPDTGKTVALWKAVQEGQQEMFKGI